MNSRNLLTWLIPLAALAVPGFLFYNWWNNLNAQSRSDLERKVKSNPGLAVFMGSPSKGNLTNPLTPTPATTQTTTPTAPVAGSTNAVAAASVSSGAAAAVMPSTAAAATAVSLSSAPAASAVVAQAAPGIVISRDPTLSPYDVVRLQQMELEAKMRSGEVAEATKRVIPKHREPPIEDSIDLQGIVEIAGGNKAIINGEMVGEGEFVNRAKVQKISASTVFFTYKGRKFVKSINK